MHFIVNNPYRILGLSITATDREIAKSSSDLSIYAEMGKSKSYKYDFSFIGDIDRSLKAIEKAKRQLEQPKDKLVHSIFWLDYDIEETYLDTLNSVNFSETIKIIPDNSIENIHNKAVLLLLSHNSKSKLKEGLRYYNKFFDHLNIEAFTAFTIGTQTNIVDIYRIFIDKILPSLRKVLTPEEIVKAFRKTSKAKYVKEQIVKPLLNDIESKIETARMKTNSEPKNAYKFGNELINRTSENIAELTSILYENDVLFTTISNKLAEQLLDCSIAYYNEIQEGTSQFDKILSLLTLELATKARKIAKSSITVERIKNNIKILQKILLRDCYKAVSFLDVVNEAYDKIQRENLSLSIYERKQINESLVLKDLREVVTKKIVKKIALSDNEELISDFNYCINLVIIKMVRSADAEELKSEFVKQLPDTNSIKKEHNLKQINEKIDSLNVELRNLLDRTFFSDEMDVLVSELKSINKWNLFRSKRKKELTIIEKKTEIDRLKRKSKKRKTEEISRIKKEIEKYKKQREDYQN